MIRTNKYLILVQLLLLNIIGQNIIQCAAKIQTEKKATEKDLELINASREGNKDKVMQLIKQGADVNAADQHGWTSLIWAAHYGNKELVELLIKSKANVNAAQIEGYTALMSAARSRNIGIVKLLLKAHADISAADSSGCAVLIYAISSVNKEVIELILRAGANMEHKNIIGEKAIDQAGIYGYQEIIKMIEDEQARRESQIKNYIENNKGWFRVKFVKKITDSTSGCLITDIAQIISEYAIEYTDLPFIERLGFEENREKTKCVIS